MELRRLSERVTEPHSAPGRAAESWSPPRRSDLEPDGGPSAHDTPRPTADRGLLASDRALDTEMPGIVGLGVKCPGKATGSEPAEPAPPKKKIADRSKTSRAPGQIGGRFATRLWGARNGVGLQSTPPAACRALKTTTE